MGFSFLFLDDCPPNTPIIFCDEEWNGTSFIGGAEGDLVWTSPNSTVSKGTVVKITTTGGAWDFITCSIGTADEVTFENFQLNATNETLYAFRGSRATPTFLAFCGSTTTGSLTNTNLILGTHAKAFSTTTLPSASFPRYNIANGTKL